ncbi:SMI1/KNR4 family protein [Kitasatospora hibisci]|uniref:SMI1/KNR4 family protein n=1 Tax=Kitasatospora hibisci TaxID=3369522 RepID=UPI003753F895
MDHRTWLSQWRADVTAAVTSMTSTFEATHGYPPGVNEVRIATDVDKPSSGRDGEALATYGLAAFYESIGEVVLGDVGNGYFVHSAHDVLQRFVEEGPVVIAESERGLVFASDGGGIQYVIDQQGAIHRSTTASLDTCELDKVAHSLSEFLDLMRRLVTSFVSTGDPGYL